MVHYRVSCAMPPLPGGRLTHSTFVSGEGWHKTLASEGPAA